MFIVIGFPSSADRRRGPIPPRLRRVKSGGMGARERAVRRRINTSYRGIEGEKGKSGKVRMRKQEYIEMQ
jgi:hypothetical protein